MTGAMHSVDANESESGGLAQRILPDSARSGQPLGLEEGSGEHLHPDLD